jgi:iron complex outermembrane recepter protein
MRARLAALFVENPPPRRDRLADNPRFSTNPPSRMKRPITKPCVLLAALALASSGAGASEHLADLSLEQLARIEVTSVGRRVQRLSEVAASVYVISREEIRRSGAGSLPELLRLAPNLQVARADANQWAVTARGFNSVLSNKLLVLVDGRTVYSPLFSGVFWEAQDLLLEDIERIEVLSGPGGTLWGSNAVNGVINVVTRSALDTPGSFAGVGLGTEQRVAGARHGGTTEAGTAWRVYGKRSLRDNTETAAGTPIRDAARRSQGGFRSDRTEGRSQLTLQGDLYESTIDQAPAARRIAGANLLARYSRELAGGGQAQLQAYFDRTERDQPGAVRERLDTFDVEWQHLARPAAGHQLLWGAGLRRQQDDLDNLAPATLAFVPADRTLDLWNVFAQDEYTVAPGLRATLGLKLEHTDYTGSEFLPNARLAWDVAPDHLLWAAVSRTVRAPSRIDRDFVTPVLNLGGADFRSEVARVYELGLRGQPRPELGYALTLFRHEFDRLRSIDARPGGAAMGNSFEGTVQGLEGWARWRVSDHWRLNASYVHQRPSFRAAPGTAPLVGTASLGNDPRHRASLGASVDLAAGVELDVQLRRVGALPDPAVPGYTALDARLGWRVRPDVELSVSARNLGDRRHPEWGQPLSRAEIERSLFFKLAWRL